MFKFTKLGMAAAMMLISAGAMASNFRGADQVYVPAAAHAGGSSGTFISDVYISNLENDAVTISVIYSNVNNGGGGAQTAFANVIDLAPKERKEFVDFFPTVLPSLSNPFGQLIFNACLKGADCVNTQDEFGVSPNYRNISVESRIYSIPPGTILSQNPPTTGQLFSGIPWYNYVSSDQAANNLDKVFMTGIKQTGGVGTAGTYRANIGLVNVSQFSTTTLVAKLMNGATNTQLGSDFTITLPPLGFSQSNLSSMFPGQSGSNLWVLVSQTNSTKTGTNVPVSCPTGCPAFLAYGSILDNVSGDATTLEPQFLKPLPDAAQAAIYPGGSGKSSLRRAVRH